MWLNGRLPDSRLGLLLTWNYMEGGVSRDSRYLISPPFPYSNFYPPKKGGGGGGGGGGCQK